MAHRFERKRKITMTPEQVEKLIEELRNMIVSKHAPLPNEPEFATSEKTLRRFLVAKKYVLKDASEQLGSAIEWRRAYQPTKIDCKWCVERPGYHAIRHVGFDKEGRTVLYGCFAQCQTQANTIDDVIAHVVYLVENAMKCSEDACNQIVLVIDCTGITLPCCNPKIGKSFGRVFGTNYPEHLARFYMVNHNPIFQSMWKTIKVFIDPITAHKVRLIRKKKCADVLTEDLGPEMTKWLLEEIKLNGTDISSAQLRFWEEPKLQTHDPRGTDSYVRKYIQPLCETRRHNPTVTLDRKTMNQSEYLPHPNLLDQINGKLKNVTVVNPKMKIQYKPSTDELLDYGIEPTVDEEASDTEAQLHQQSLAARLE